ANDDPAGGRGPSLVLVLFEVGQEKRIEIVVVVERLCERLRPVGLRAHAEDAAFVAEEDVLTPAACSLFREQDELSDAFLGGKIIELEIDPRVARRKCV